MSRNQKDIILKELVGTFSDGALKVLGLEGVDVVRSLPTELAKVGTQEVDLAFEMANGSVLHVEFQTTRERTLHRFLSYDVELATKHLTKVRTVVLYVGDIADAPEEMDIGTAVYRVENIFLSKFDGDAALQTVDRHLSTGEWTAEDRIRLAFALHMRYPHTSKHLVFERVLELIERIPEIRERDYVAAVLVGLSDRILSTSERVRLKEGLMRMTELAKEIFEDGRLVERRELAINLLKDGMPISKVAELSRLNEKEVEELRKQIH